MYVYICVIYSDTCYIYIYIYSFTFVIIYYYTVVFYLVLASIKSCCDNIVLNLKG